MARNIENALRESVAQETATKSQRWKRVMSCGPQFTESFKCDYLHLSVIKGFS